MVLLRLKFIINEMILVFDIVNFPFLHVEQQGGGGGGGGVKGGGEGGRTDFFYRRFTATRL